MLDEKLFRVQKYDNPTIWRLIMVEDDSEVEAVLRFQGIIHEKHLPPVNTSAK